ncbi:MAG: DUF418 domain-containing protein [Ilumatobacteraceae bacterium]|nr:DUF418 domain-containing protein [Acidimicrobiales bacterium]MCB9393490.1 DUF418 domain-containing protein [Acidimicrobiaceae bacterium]
MTHAAAPDAEPADAAPSAGRPAERRVRLVGPDVVRALALAGVVAMNYHGYLNGSGAAAGRGASLPERWFDPWNGVLSTRFAATFVVVAGIGVSLLTERSRAAADAAAITDHRWRLVRRGVLLYAGGFVLDWIWPGTILFFYGAYFVAGALLFTLRTRWLVMIGAMAAVAAAAIEWWVQVRRSDGRAVGWLTDPRTLETTSPRGLVLDTLVNGTHPLLPWLAFICAGMVLGRSVRTAPLLRLAAIGASVTALTYLLNHTLTNGRAGDTVWVTVWSTRPFDRGLLYTVGTLGSSLAACGVVMWAAQRWASSPVVGVLARAGRTTLSIYLAHVLVFRVLVDRTGIVDASGLGAALVFAVGFWVVAVLAAAWWVRVVGMGPLERVYRRFGG